MTIDVNLPDGPPFFRFSDHEEFKRVLLEAHFDAPSVAQSNKRTNEQTWWLRGPETPFRALLHGGVRVAAALLNAQHRDCRAPGCRKARTGPLLSTT